jgi:phage repressor protein C with HTH and peptisase S24 domain
MKEIRRSRLVALLASPRFNGDRAKFCADAGITNGRLTQLLDPSEPFGDVAARNLCDALGLRENYFSVEEKDLWLPGHDAVDALVKTIEIENNPDYPSIRRVKLKAQAGASGYAVEYQKEDDGPPIVFRADWYKSKGYKPEKMLALRVTGESMIPNMYEGDLIVINTLSTAPKDGVPFLVSYEGEIVVKRLTRDDGMWWLTSDNPDQRRYGRKICNGGTEIIGEVVYRQTERV